MFGPSLKVAFRLVFLALVARLKTLPVGISFFQTVT